MLFLASSQKWGKSVRDCTKKWWKSKWGCAKVWLRTEWDCTIVFGELEWDCAKECRRRLMWNSIWWTCVRCVRSLWNSAKERRCLWDNTQEIWILAMCIA